MAEPITSDKGFVPMKTEEPEEKHSVSLSNGTSEGNEKDIGDQTLKKYLPDTLEKKRIANQNTTQSASEISASQSQGLGITVTKSRPDSDHGKEIKDLQKPTENSIDVPNVKKNKDASSVEYSEDLDCSNITSDVSTEDTHVRVNSCYKIQQENIHQQAQRLLGRNYPIAANSFTSSSTKSVLKENSHSYSSTTESKSIDSSPNISSSSLSENNSPSQSMDCYNFRNRNKEKEKCLKQRDNGDLPLGHEVANAYEQLVHGKEGSPKHVNVAARKLLSEHSECRVPEYFQKTLKREKPVESSPKLPIPRSDFRGPVNISLKGKDYLKNAVKPTVAPCTPYFREVTMDLNILSHGPGSVVTIINKDGTEQESIPGQISIGKKLQRISHVPENQKLSASVDNEDAMPNCTSSSVRKHKKPEHVIVNQTARKSCASAISKKANTHRIIRSVSDNSASTLEKLSSKEVVSKSEIVLSPILGTQNRKLSSSDDPDDSDSDDGSDDMYTPPKHLKLTARKSFPNIPSPPRHYYKARKSVPFSKKLANQPKLHKTAGIAPQSVMQKSTSPVQNVKYSVANTTAASTSTVSDSSNRTTSSDNDTSTRILMSHGLGKQRTFVVNTLSLLTGEDINNPIKNSCLHAANTKQLLPQSTSNGMVTNYVLVPILSQKDHQKTTSSAGMSAELLVSKQKISLPLVNNSLKKTSRKIVSIRRGKRKRKAPRRFQSSQSSDDERRQPVSRKRRLADRRRGSRNKISSPQRRKTTRAMTLSCKQLFKNKGINRIRDKQELGCEQENLLASNSKIILAPETNQQLKCVKSSKANLLLPHELVKGRTVNELLNIIDKSNGPIKNGERPLSILLPATSAVTNLLSPTNAYSQGYLLQQPEASILLPVTTSVASPSMSPLRNTDKIANTLVKDKLVDELVLGGEVNKDPEIILKSVAATRSHDHTGSVVNLNVNTANVTSQSLPAASSTSVLKQTKCHSDGKYGENNSNGSSTQENQSSEKETQEIVEIQKLKNNPIKNKTVILPPNDLVKESIDVSCIEPNNTSSKLNAMKLESDSVQEGDAAPASSDSATQAAKKTPGSCAGSVRPLVKGVNGSGDTGSVDASVDSVSDHDEVDQSISGNNKKPNSSHNYQQNNVAEISANDLVSKNTVAKDDAAEGSLISVSEDTGYENSVQENGVTVDSPEEISLKNNIELNSIIKDNSDHKNNDVTENVLVEENMSVDLNQDISEQSSVKDNTPAEDNFQIEASSDNELNKNDVPEGDLCKKSYYKQRKKRKLNSQSRAQLMRKKKKQKKLNLEAMESDRSENASEVSGDFLPSLASSRSNSVSTLGSLDDCRSLTGTGDATRRKDVKVKPALCCCRMEREPSGTNPGTCQAVEYIDGGLLLCEKEVETSVLLQPSSRIPARALCRNHRRKALAHGWCPGCGCFCSMGTFVECRRDHTRHHFHSECIAEINNILYCPHCGDDASRAHKVTNVVPEELSLITPKELQLRRQITLPSALLETVEGSVGSCTADQHYESTKKKARMGGKQLILPREFEDCKQEKMDSHSVKFKNGKMINIDLLPPGPTRKTLTTALKCINTIRSKRLGFTPKNLYLPAVQGDLLKVIALLVEGFDPNHRFPEHNHETAMHAAANKGHLAILYILLQAGGNCNTKDEDIQTPLMCAASNQQLDCMKHLVSHGADVTCKDDEGTAALHIAAKDGFIQGVRYLTSLTDTNVNIQDDGGWTPLVWAAEARHIDVVQLLLERGCDPNIRDKEGNSGLHWAAYAGAHDIIKLFIESNCDVNAVNHNGDTPLHISAREDRYESVVTLILREANTLLKNRENDTPLDCSNPESNAYLALQVNQKLRQASALRTVRTERILSNDIARGREARPIQVVNAVDDFSYPKDFQYVAHSCEKSSLNIDRRIIHMKGCKCEDDCSLDSCFCAHSSTTCWYNKDGKLVDEFNYQDPPLIFECGRACSCWTTCKNRVVQHGIRCHLQLFRTNQMGWGLRALQRIPKGTFVCEYAGELISDAEADRRQDDSYLFDLDNREGDVYCIDARYYGNISRFINHLCEPNIVPVRIFMEHHDLRFPRIVFFTSRDVNPYEELGFDYGDKFWAIKSKYFNCCCGSPYCKHPLPQPDLEAEDAEEEEIIVD